MYSDHCDCSDRSRAFPAEAEVTVDVDGECHPAGLHWRDGAGWVPCVVDESSYRTLQKTALDLGLPVAPFEHYLTATESAAAELNRKSLSHWQREYRKALEKERAHRASLVSVAENILAEKRSGLLTAECRLAVAELSDPHLAEMATRLLDEGWSQSPPALLESAKAVLR